MTGPARRWVALVTALLAGCATVEAPRTIMRPHAATPAVQPPRPGSHWVYQSWGTRDPDARVEARFEVKSVAPARIVETRRLPNGRVVEQAHEPGAYLFSGGSANVFAFAPYLPVFEHVAPGDAWREVPFRRLGPCSDNPNWVCTFEARVAAAERITVAAGSFDTLRIEVDQNVTASKPTARYRFRALRKATFWYAPEVKRYVKASWRSVGGDWRGADREAELVSYRIL